MKVQETEKLKLKLLPVPLSLLHYKAFYLSLVLYFLPVWVKQVQTMINLAESGAGYCAICDFRGFGFGEKYPSTNALLAV
jgi:hypothetical protein